MTPVATIGVVGAGAMGRGIAELAARNGFSVRLYDAADGAVARAIAAVGDRLGGDVAKGRLETAEAVAISGRVAVASLGETARADLVIEAIVESLAAKQALFRVIEAEARPGTILATNTSSLSVAKIVEALGDPGRFAGLHFFNPPTRMRVVEIVRGPKTRDETVATLQAVAEELGQRALLVGDTPGFLVNHLGRGYAGEALRILDEGIATPAEIDAIAKGALHFKMGPFELLDLTGLDVSAEVTRQVWKGFGEEPRFKLAPIAEKRVAMGLLGRKSGGGFYEYDSDGKARIPRTGRRDAAPPSRVPVRLVGIPPDLAAEVSHLFPPELVTSDSDAVAVVGPIGSDVATEARRLALDPKRTVGVDPIFTDTATVAGAHGADAALAGGVAASIRAAGHEAVVVRDGPGMPAQRIAAMIVLIAAEAAARGLATPADIDAATRLALAWPRGPLELGDAVGARRIASIAAGLHSLTADRRWRRSAWLDARAKAGQPLAQSLAAAALPTN
jgi:3-hydroxybutyryl-CoA dehydrogenase